MKHYLCPVCEQDWFEGKERTALEPITRRTCTGCMNEARDKLGVWIRHSSLSCYEGKYYKVDENGHSLPSGHHTHEQWEYWGDLFGATLRIYKEPEPTTEPPPTTTLEIEIAKALEDYKGRLRAVIVERIEELDSHTGKIASLCSEEARFIRNLINTT